MRNLKALLAIGAVLLISAACGGSGPATAGPDGNTPAPQATTDPGAGGGGGGGGGGGSTGGGTGQIHIEIGGPKPATVDQPFFAFGSRFVGPAGLQLNFTTEDAAGIAGITQPPGTETVTVTWTGEEGVFSSVECTTSNWNIGATSGSGTFDCSNGFATTADGQYLTGVTLRGNFTASQ